MNSSHFNNCPSGIQFLMIVKKTLMFTAKARTLPEAHGHVLHSRDDVANEFSKEGSETVCQNEKGTVLEFNRAQ